MSSPVAFRCAITLAASLLATAAPAAETGCLSSGDATEAVATHRVLSPGQVLILIQRAVPNADILRAALCREPEALVYRITALRPDGRLVRVTVDAPSGKVKTIH